MNIMRGDAYPVPFVVLQDGMTIEPEMISKLEVCIGTSIRKVYPDGGVNYDPETASWFVDLTQEETLKLPVTDLSVIARVQFPAPKDDVIGVELGTIHIVNTHSKVVL